MTFVHTVRILARAAANLERGASLDRDASRSGGAHQLTIAVGSSACAAQCESVSVHDAIPNFPEVIHITAGAVVHLERQALGGVNIGEDAVASARTAINVEDTFVGVLDGVVVLDREVPGSVGSGNTTVIHAGRCP